MEPTWKATTNRHGVALVGPRLDDQARDLAERIADAAFHDDDLHERWDAFVTARGNRRRAERYGDGDVGLALSAESATWSALAPDLPGLLWLNDGEARLVGRLLGEAAGPATLVTAP